MKRICVYCGSSNRVSDRYLACAKQLGRLLAERGIGVVFGGGRVGLMGALADGALEAGGEVLGVIPEKLMSLELGHTGVTELFIVHGMHARKAMMASLAEGFIALPGGFGTLEELFEMITWGQLDYHRKPVGVLNVDGFYDGLIQLLDHAAAEGFVRPMHRDLLVAETTAEALLDSLAQVRYPSLDEWIADP